MNVLGSSNLAFAQGVEDFYRNNRITIIVGVPPGGAYDLNARLVGRLMREYIPGHPDVVVQNMPGANTTVAANYILNTAPQDGTVIGTSSRTMPYATLLGAQGIRYDPATINWLGSTSGESGIVVSWHSSPVKTPEDLFKNELIVGATDVGGDFYLYPHVLNQVIGTKFKIVTGYRGQPEIATALERGEVQGLGTFSWGGLVVAYDNWLKNKTINLLMQINVGKHPDLPDVPLATEFAKTDRQRELLRVFMEMKRFAFPFFVGQNVAPEKVKVLREAFEKSMLNSEFISEQTRRGRELSWVSGPEMSAALRATLSLPADVRDEVKALAK
jgi:hypothetical protein